MAAVISFGQLPEEEAAFVTYLQKTGDVWARAVNDDPIAPMHMPLPVADFLKQHASEILAYHSVSLYLGFRNEVFHPAISIHEVIEGGNLVPFLQGGQVVEGVQTIVGGTKVKRKFIDSMASQLIRYDRGEFRTVDELVHSNLCFYPGAFSGQKWIAHPQSFMKWGKKIFDWMRRHTPESVPVWQCNYELRATRGVAEACKKGLKLTY